MLNCSHIVLKNDLLLVGVACTCTTGTAALHREKNISGKLQWISIRGVITSSEKPVILVSRIAREENTA